MLCKDRATPSGQIRSRSYFNAAEFHVANSLDPQTGWFLSICRMFDTPGVKNADNVTWPNVMPNDGENLTREQKQEVSSLKSFLCQCADTVAHI